MHFAKLFRVNWRRCRFRHEPVMHDEQTICERNSIECGVHVNFP
jgi:hypothetical protein